MISFSLKRLSFLVSTLVLGWCVLAVACPGLLVNYSPVTGVATEHLRGPGWSHWCGTDQLGRDVLSRIVHGARQTLPAAAIATSTALVLGSIAGGVSALSGRSLDLALSSVVDVMLSIPELLLTLTIVILTGFGPAHAALAVGLSQAAGFARIVRARVKQIAAMTYIEAAELSGTRFAGLIRWHIIPNLLPSVTGLAVLRYSSAILSISTLGFLGYGAPPPTPEWGLMVAEGRDYLATAWWMTTFPGLAIVVVSLAVNRLNAAIDMAGERQ